MQIESTDTIDDAMNQSTEETWEAHYEKGGRLHGEKVKENEREGRPVEKILFIFVWIINKKRTRANLDQSYSTIGHVNKIEQSTSEKVVFFLGLVLKSLVYRCINFSLFDQVTWSIWCNAIGQIWRLSLLDVNKRNDKEINRVKITWPRLTNQLARKLHSVCYSLV